jgi:putative DNA primase/helicase
MMAAGIETPPDEIIADGKVHRFVSMPGRKSANGWYIVHPDPVAPEWWFGDWGLQIKERGQGDPGRTLEPEEIAARKKRLRDLRIKIAAEEAQFQAGAAIEARQRLERCGPVPADHPYLKKKGIDPCGVGVDGRNLLVPMRDVSGKLWSLQEIGPDGHKHNQDGGRRKGCFFQIGEIDKIFCIGEGFSTCATLHMATGYAAMAAGEAGNLEAVAVALREKYPATQIIICADDDWRTKVNGKPKNVGKLAAIKAALAVDGVLALPWFSRSARPARASDFNDMAKLHGLDEVKTCIKLAMVKHEEDRQRERDAEPPPATPEDFGLSTANESAAFSDDALALRFAEKHADALRFVAPWARWLEWDQNRWRIDQKLRTMSLARDLCREAAERMQLIKVRQRLLSANTVAAVERLSRSDQRLAATIDQWDRDPWLLNTPTGTVDLKTGRLRENRRTDFITKLAGSSPDGDCPRWREFINTITGGDADLTAFIQRMLGYALTGSTQEQCLFFLYGTGANGKSVLLNTVSSILGEYHTTAPIETFTVSTMERHPTELAGLRGARLVTSIETEEGRRWAEAKIKNLTGGDKISARFMRQDFFEFVPQFKLVIAGNHKPSLRTVDEAIRRRFHLVPFAVTIPPGKRYPQLADKLKAEWPGVLRWMIHGCLDWQRKGLNPPAAVRDATAAYLEAEDAIATWIDDCCTRDPNAWTSSTALFGSWAAWARQAGEAIGTMKAFTQAMENRAGVRPHRRMDGRGFQGLRINPTAGQIYE